MGQTLPASVFELPEQQQRQMDPYALSQQMGQLPFYDPFQSTHAPVGDTGPGAVAVMAAGAAGGMAWLRRRGKR